MAEIVSQDVSGKMRNQTGRPQPDLTGLNARVGNVESRFDYVTYTMFGAKLNGVDDDTPFIQACHDFANQNNLRVVQHQGIINLNQSVIVQTSVDLSGCTFLVNDGKQGKTFYRITSKNTPVNVTSFVQSEFVKGTNRIPSLTTYKDHFITIDSSEIFAVRYTDYDNAYKRESIFLTDDGGLVGGGLIHDFTTGALTITAVPYDYQEIVFNSPKIEWSFTSASYSSVIISSERSNVKIKNVYMTVTKQSSDASALSGYKGASFTIQGGYNITLENWVAENIVETGMSGYVLLLDDIVNIKMVNCTLLNGWGAIASNNVKRWSVYDSVINRIDSHLTLGDLLCKNVIFEGQWGVYVSYGGGKITLDDCTSKFADLDYRSDRNVVRLRNDYGIIYEGDIEVRNHTVDCYDTTSAYVVNWSGDKSGDYKCLYNIKFPNLNVQNIKFLNKDTGVMYGYKLSSLDTLLTTLTNNNLELILPNVKIDGVRLQNTNDNTYFRAVDFLVTNASLSDKIKKIRYYLTVKDVIQKLHSTITDGYTSAQTSSTQLANQMIYVSIAKPSVDGYNFKVLIDRCEGLAIFRAASDIFEVVNSRFAGQPQGTNGFPKEFIVRQSTWFLYPSTNGVSSTIDCPNLSAYHNVMVLAKVNGSAVPPYEFNYATSQNILFGNIFTNPGITSSTLVNKYYKYVNGSVYSAPATL